MREHHKVAPPPAVAFNEADPKLPRDIVAGVLTAFLLLLLVIVCLALALYWRHRFISLKEATEPSVYFRSNAPLGEHNQ